MRLRNRAALLAVAGLLLFYLIVGFAIEKSQCWVSTDAELARVGIPRGIRIVDITRYQHVFDNARSSDSLEQFGIVNRVIRPRSIESLFPSREYRSLARVDMPSVERNRLFRIFSKQYTPFRLTMNGWRFPVVFEMEIKSQFAGSISGTFRRLREGAEVICNPNIGSLILSEVLTGISYRNYIQYGQYQGDCGIYDKSTKSDLFKAVLLVCLSVVFMKFGGVLIGKTWGPCNFDLPSNVNVVGRVMISAVLIWIGMGFLVTAIFLIARHTL